MLVPNDEFFALVEDALKEKNEVTFAVRGTSMRPFMEGDRDSVTIVKPGELKVGDAVLARLASGVYILHRIIRKDGSLLTLQGDGLRDRTESCTTSSVIGKVSTYIRPHHTIRADSKAFGLAVRLWMSAGLLRRPLLYVYRRVSKTH